MRYTTKSESETAAVGHAFGATLKAGDVVALNGDLGAGKTAFVRGAAAALGYSGRVTSPTFAVVNEYRGSLPVFHIDAYRLTSSGELIDLGFDEYLERGGVIFIEWAELVTAALPEDCYTVVISKAGDQLRTIDINGGDICGC